MRYALIFALALAATALASPRGARAQGWCAWYDPYTYNCGFQTFQQCLETVRGVGGECRRDVQGYDRPRERRRDDRR
ncbi:MAG: DUF3551 domain-containing protein [Rhizobiales bacterium]|nr:DUF3551 domain-containing protein [Hyphomicrobiales bacterium]